MTKKIIITQSNQPSAWEPWSLLNTVSAEQLWFFPLSMFILQSVWSLTHLPSILCNTKYEGKSGFILKKSLLWGYMCHRHIYLHICFANGIVHWKYLRRLASTPYLSGKANCLESWALDTKAKNSRKRKTNVAPIHQTPGIKACLNQSLAFSLILL